MARPTKRTPENRAIILRYLLLGCTRETAAAKAKMVRSCLYDWLQADAGFRTDVELAEHDAAAEFETAFFRQCQRDWRAAHEWLMRRRPDWRPLPKQTELSGPDGGPIPIQELPPELSTEELRALARADANAH